ncbi:hypothetical protein A2U01_0097136, partial [Trifolium medium]|nr:hypothetical protein [Trifolium medium]
MRSKLSCNAALFSGSVAVSLLQLGGSISTGIMAFAPYTNVKGGSLVEDCAVVWYDQRIPGRCSTQLSLLE